MRAVPPAGLALLAALAAPVAVPAARAADVSPALPTGVMIEPVDGTAYLAGPGGVRLLVRSADAAMPQNGAIAPLAAGPIGPPTGDWSVVGDGAARQWAYRGQPLYLPTAEGVPPKGWQRVPMVAPALQAPAGISVRGSAPAGGDLLVDSHGMTLYVASPEAERDCTGACAAGWRPLEAGRFARAAGDWTPADRPDGRRQWRYRGQPLYTSQDDRRSGEVNGRGAGWQPALVARYFMPAGISVRRSDAGWPMLVAADGRTLYARDQFRYGFGGHSVNDGPPPVPATGRAIGPQGCEGDCTRRWQPLAAPADARGGGYWSVVLRGDGVRQWAYQGFPLYTNAEDSRPGDMRGRDVFTLTDGGSALYWRVASP